MIQAFINVPVQFYHHHNNSVNNNSKEEKITIKGFTNQIAFTKPTEKNKSTLTEICPVCQHQYTVYYNDCVIEEITTASKHIAKRFAGYKLQLAAQIPLQLSNKSPPAIA